jgi:hypothetical protein
MSRSIFATPAVAGALLLWSSPALGSYQLEGHGPLAGGTLSLSDRFALRYYQVDDTLPGFEDSHPNLHDYVEEVNRLNVLVNKGSFAAGAQIDQVGLFANRYYLDDELQRSLELYDPDIRSPWPDAYLGLEKLYLRNKGEHLEVNLGDGYVSFGRGIALNMVRNTNIDLDSSLRGVRAVVRAGNWDFTGVTGLTNPQQVQLDNRNVGIHGDNQHMISGLRAERFGLGPLNVGVHGVVYSFSRPTDAEAPGFVQYQQPVDVVVGGATVEGFGLLGVDLIAEFDWFEYRSSDFFGGEDPDPGYALYASASGYPGKAVVLLEAKHYVNTERINTFTGTDNYEVAVAPTLEYERVITEDSSAAVNSNDITGVRLRVDYPVKPGVLMPYISVASFHDRELGGLHFNQAPETIVHPVAGVQWLGKEAHVIATAGGRADIRGDDTGADVNAHVDVDIHLPAGKLGSLELSSAFMRFMWGDNPAQQSDFTDVVNALALHATEKWTFILWQDFSDNPLIDSTGNIAENVYGAAEVQYKPSSAITTSLFYGAYKAGIRCAGGQCRSLPGFEGLRFGLNGTF